MKENLEPSMIPRLLIDFELFQMHFLIYDNIDEHFLVRISNIYYIHITTKIYPLHTQLSTINFAFLNSLLSSSLNPLP